MPWPVKANAASRKGTARRIAGIAPAELLQGNDARRRDRFNTISHDHYPIVGENFGCWIINGTRYLPVIGR
jgi:hypothetical protein